MACETYLGVNGPLDQLIRLQNQLGLQRLRSEFKLSLQLGARLFHVLVEQSKSFQALGGGQEPQ